MKMRALLGTALLAIGLLFTACGGSSEETHATDTTVTTPAPGTTTHDTTVTTTTTHDTTVTDTTRK